MGAVTGFHHVSVKTREWDRTMRFYTGLLGCVTKVAWRAAPARAAMLQIPGAGCYVEIFEDMTFQPVPNGSIGHFALRTDDVDAMAEKVRAFGAPITVEPKSVTIPNTTALGPVPVRIFFCEGPNGELIEFMQNERT